MRIVHSSDDNIILKFMDFKTDMKLFSLFSDPTL